jgi:hypothetical protein
MAETQSIGSSTVHSRALAVARIGVRVTFILQLLLGLGLWTGLLDRFTPLHIAIGLLFVLGLWSVAVIGGLAGANPVRVALLVVWGVILPVFGLTQDRLLTGDLHWIIQVLHLAVGMAGIAQAEVLARSVERGSPRAAGGGDAPA